MPNGDLASHDLHARCKDENREGLKSSEFAKIITDVHPSVQAELERSWESQANGIPQHLQKVTAYVLQVTRTTLLTAKYRSICQKR